MNLFKKSWKKYSKVKLIHFTRVHISSRGFCLIAWTAQSQVFIQIFQNKMCLGKWPEMWWNTQYINGRSISYQFVRVLDTPFCRPNQKNETFHEKNNMLRIAWNAKKYVHQFVFLFGNPNLRGGEGGVDPVGTKSQLNPKELSEGSP